MQAHLAIELVRTGNGSVAARGALATAPFWCRWDGTTLWFVGSAATPVGEDDITIDLHIGPGVSAAVRSVAAMVVYAARGAGTTMTTRLHVGEGASLDWRPEPVIVTARAQHRGRLIADVAAGGVLVADEVVVLGRSNEVAGPFVSATELRAGGVPISLTSFDTEVPGWSGPGGTGGAKVLGTRVVLDRRHAGGGPGPTGGTVDAGTVVLHPDGGGALATTLAPDPGRARGRLDAVLPAPDAIVEVAGPLSTRPSTPVPALVAALPVGGG